jgi:peptidoglycan/LPS O-acetylase OafA/YrhL
VKLHNVGHDQSVKLVRLNFEQKPGVKHSRTIRRLGRGKFIRIMYLSDVAHSRDNNFNLIRFIAAFLVLVSHSYGIVLHLESNEPLMLAVGYPVTSGFLVAGSLLRKPDLKSFFKARALRIYPALVVAMFLTVFVLGPLLTSVSLTEYFSQLQPYKYFVKNSLSLSNIDRFLPGMFENNPLPRHINGSLWTLPVEVRCYISMGLLGTVFLFSKASDKFKRTAFIVLATALFIWFLQKHLSQGYLAGWQRLFMLFYIGASFSALRDKIKINTLLAIIAAALLFLPLVIEGSFYFVYPVCLAYLLFYLAYVPAGFVREFNKLGDYSYGLYIYAFPIQQALMQLFPELTVLSMTIWATIATLVPSILSWHLIEKRALAYK